MAGTNKTLLYKLVLTLLEHPSDGSLQPINCVAYTGRGCALSRWWNCHMAGNNIRHKVKLRSWNDLICSILDRHITQPTESCEQFNTTTPNTSQWVNFLNTFTTLRKQTGKLTLKNTLLLRREIKAVKSLAFWDGWLGFHSRQCQ
jgi:hypothetical protein